MIRYLLIYSYRYQGCVDLVKHQELPNLVAKLVIWFIDNCGIPQPQLARVSAHLRKPVSAARCTALSLSHHHKPRSLGKWVPPFRTIYGIEIRKEAFLLPESTATRDWTARFRPVNATLRVIDDSREDCMNQVLDTLFELAKTGRECSSRTFQSEFAKYLHRNEHGMLQGVCRKSESPSHLVIPYLLDMPQLSRELVHHSKAILLNKLQITLDTEISRDDLRKLVENLCDICSERVTSRDQIHPDVALPCAIITLRARVIGPPKHWKTMFVHAEGTEDNRRFVAIDTLTAA